MLSSLSGLLMISVRFLDSLLHWYVPRLPLIPWGICLRVFGIRALKSRLQTTSHLLQSFLLRAQDESTYTSTDTVVYVDDDRVQELHFFNVQKMNMLYFVADEKAKKGWRGSEDFRRSKVFWRDEKKNHGYTCVKYQRRFYVCQGLVLPKHQIRLYVCHQLRLYVCRQMRSYVCVQMRLYGVSPNAFTQSATELASLAYLYSLCC